MSEIKVLLNKDNKKKKQYFVWEHLEEIKLNNTPQIGDIIEHNEKLLIVDSMNYDFEKDITKVVVKTYQQPLKN